MNSMKSKIFAAFLSFVMVFACAPALSSHADGGAPCGDNVKYKIDGKTITIFGKGAMWNYCHPSNYDDEATVKPAPWLNDGNDTFYDKYEKIVIEEGVTYVGEYAFAECYKVTSVKIASSVTKIGENAFDGCSSLGSISLPGKLKTIGYRAFYNTAITSLFIPNSVTTIGQEAFSCCKKLTSVTGGKGLKKISAGAFSRCNVLKTFKIVSKKLNKIGSSVFYADKQLKTLYLKKTTKLTKKGVKKSLRGSSVKKIKVKKSKIRKYRKIFKKSNSGRKVKVTK